VGFFSDHESIEEDDYTEFVELATEAQVKEDVYFGVVTDEDVARYFIENKTIDRTPSFLLVC
jgi:aspartate ammonia-lyase